MRGKYNKQAFESWAADANRQKDDKPWKVGILAVDDFADLKELEAARDAIFKKTVDCMTKRQLQ
jgi:hypothetical protein